MFVDKHIAELQQEWSRLRPIITTWRRSSPAHTRKLKNRLGRSTLAGRAACESECGDKACVCRGGRKQEEIHYLCICLAILMLRSFGNFRVGVGLCKYALMYLNRSIVVWRLTQALTNAPHLLASLPSVSKLSTDTDIGLSSRGCLPLHTLENV